MFSINIKKKYSNTHMHFEKTAAKVVSIGFEHVQTNNMHHNVFKTIMNYNITNGAHHVMTPTIPLYFPIEKIRTFK